MAESAMVTARMNPEKKQAGIKVLKDLGTTPSRVINRLFDHIIDTGSLPEGLLAPTRDRDRLLAEAEAWADSLVKLAPPNVPERTVASDAPSGPRLTLRSGSTVNLLLDADVVSDFLLAREPVYAAARSLIAHGSWGDYRLWMAAGQTPAVLAQLAEASMEPAVAREALSRLQERVSVSSTASQDVEHALASTAPYNEAVLSAMAQRMGVAAVVCADPSRYQGLPVPAMGCAAWLEVFARERGIAYAELGERIE